jgi:hypothetical protein
MKESLHKLGKECSIYAYCIILSWNGRMCMGKLVDVQSTVIKTAVKKLNCWEFKKCGRQPGGEKVAELGVCPATIAGELDQAHDGKNAGRACWVVAGSLCGGKIQGTYAKKLLNCWRCEFMNIVKQEEDPSEFGFSHTQLGMHNALEKQKAKGTKPQKTLSEQKSTQR